MKINEIKLENGATIIDVPVEGAKTVTIQFGFKTGSRAETGANAGVSHFLEHMVFKGSKKRPTAKAISADADRIGAEFNAATGKEYTYFYLHTIKENFNLSLDILGDMLLNPLLDEEEFNKEKGTIIQELHRTLDNPEQDIYRKMELTLYGDTPMGREIVGSEDSINRMTIDQLRDYYQKNYVGANLTLAIVGDLPEDATNVVSEYLKQFPSGEATVWEQATFADEKIGLINKDTGQVQIALMIPSFDLFDKRRHAVEVAASVLGGFMMSSRLFTEIREKRGWAYRIWAYADEATDTGYLGIFGGIKKDKVEDTLRIVRDEILNLAETITEEEVERSIGNIKGSSIIKYENVNHLANYLLITKMLTGKAESPEDYVSELEKITRADIVKVAKELFVPNRIYLALIGPFQDEEKFVKILTQ